MKPETISTIEIIIQTVVRFWPVWVAMAVTLGAGYLYRARLGVFGRLYGSPIGLAGVAIVMFWFFTAAFADMIAVMQPLDQKHGISIVVQPHMIPTRGSTLAFHLLLK